MGGRGGAGRLAGDERAEPGAGADEALPLQLPVGLVDRVRVDGELATACCAVGSWSPGSSIPIRRAWWTCCASCR